MVAYITHENDEDELFRLDYVDGVDGFSLSVYFCDLDGAIIRLRNLLTNENL